MQQANAQPINFIGHKTQWISIAVATLVLLVCFGGFYQLQHQRNE